jgi:ABC-2 type transport system permease protein
MRNTWAIAKRELGAYFNSPIAYIVITVFLIISGYLFFSQLFLSKEASMRDFFGFMPLIFIFFAPAITMRLLAEEKGTGTLEVLITLPVTDWQVVLGKFFAALGLLATALGLTFAWAITVAALGPLDKGPVIAGYLGLLLMGGAYLAIGLAASAFTRNQIVAFIVGFAICFALFLSGKVLPFVPRSLAPIVEYLSLDFHFQNLTRGIVDTRDLVYYGTLIGGCLLLTVQSLDSRRWR